MTRKELILGMAIALLIAGIISWFASPWPDGLEKIARDKGFMHRGKGEAVLKAPFADYTVPKIPSEKLATSLSGIAGTLLVLALTYLLASRLAKKGN